MQRAGRHRSASSFAPQLGPAAHPRLSPLLFLFFSPLFLRPWRSPRWPRRIWRRPGRPRWSSRRRLLHPEQGPRRNGPRTQHIERAGDCDWRRALVGLFDWCCLLHAHDLPVVLVLFFSLCAGRLRRKEGVVRLNSHAPSPSPFLFPSFVFSCQPVNSAYCSFLLFERLERCVFLSQTTTPPVSDKRVPAIVVLHGRDPSLRIRRLSFPYNSHPGSVSFQLKAKLDAHDDSLEPAGACNITGCMNGQQELRSSGL